MTAMPASDTSDDVSTLGADRPRTPIIEANGSEYLVTINGSVFVALSLAQAETIAYRTGRKARTD